MKDVIRNQNGLPVSAAMAKVSETDPSDPALKDLIDVIAKQPVRSVRSLKITSRLTHSKTEDSQQ